MRTRAVHITALLAGLLLASTLAAGLMGVPLPGASPEDHAPAAAEHEPDEPAVEPATAEANRSEPRPEAGDRDAPGPASKDLSTAGPPAEPAVPAHEHFRAGQPGETPSRAQAGELPFQLRSFTVRGDAGLAEMDEKGYLSGSGTTEDPYIIDGFRVREDLTIRDTSQAIVIRNSYIEGQLTLNYNGPDVYVHHNHIKDLRVNENVDRRADTTAGLFEENEIAFIGQLRHFAGELRENSVGPRPDGVVTTFLSDTGERPLPDDIVWNFDGYHLASVHNNTVDGRVDVKLHGHFHGTCNACAPHDHAEEAEFPPDNQRADGLEAASHHSLRHHTLSFQDNTIRASETGVALRFYDDRHAADDQTANSEPNEYLEDRHQHNTYLRVSGNRLTGGSLLLDIVNPEDERHQDQRLDALVHLTGNSVTLQKPRDTNRLTAAYVIETAQEMRLVAHANSFVFTEQASSLPSGYKWVTQGEPGPTTGFLLDTVDTSLVSVAATEGRNANYGVTLEDASQAVQLELTANDFDASEEEVHHA